MTYKELGEIITNLTEEQKKEPVVVYNAQEGGYLDEQDVSHMFEQNHLYIVLNKKY